MAPSCGQSSHPGSQLKESWVDASRPPSWYGPLVAPSPLLPWDLQVFLGLSCLWEAPVPPVIVLLLHARLFQGLTTAHEQFKATLPDATRTPGHPGNPQRGVKIVQTYHVSIRHQPLHNHHASGDQWQMGACESKGLGGRWQRAIVSFRRAGIFVCALLIFIDFSVVQ